MEETRARKRLRGWKLQQQIGDPCQKDAIEHEENPLCARLIELWSCGRVSATQVAEICNLSLLNGCERPEVVAIAKCGNFGQKKSNAQGGLIKIAVQKYDVTRSTFCEMPCERSKDSKSLC